MVSLETRSWIRRLVQSWLARPRLLRQAKNDYRLQIETLEDRTVPTTYTVTTALGSGTGSLAAAVQSANSNTTSPSIINFSPTVFATPQTITLTASLTLSNATEPVTIQGPTGVAVTISGNSQYQDFGVNTSGVVATIQNLTIAHGSAASNNGGGFAISAGNVTIDDCTISNNNSGHNGGGISVSGTAVVLLENSTFTGNSAANGGALDFDGGAVTVNGCLFTNNSATAGGLDGRGGAILSESTNPFTVMGSTVTGNTATSTYYGGGGIEVHNGNLVLIGSTITGNSSVGDVSGGGIFNMYPSSTVTLIDDVIWNNTGTSPQDVSTGYNGAQMSVSYCLVGQADTANITVSGPGNNFNLATTPAILGSLANNAGPTRSMMPVAGSPEISAGGSVTTANAAVTSVSTTTLSVANGHAFAAASITPALSFVNQPANTTAGAPMSPVTVQVSWPVDFEEYIQVDSEIMEVVGLTINTSNGTATLDVERGMDGTTATTHAANAAIYLVSDQRGMVVDQSMPHVDIGAVQSAGTTPTAGLGLALTMGISSGNLNGPTTALTSSSGQATFNNLSVPLAGTYHLIAAGVLSSNSFSVGTGTDPIVSGISPGLGSPGGTVTITGTNFTGASVVDFGATPATSFLVNSNTSITATIPAGTGIVDITVINAVGTSGVSASDRFSYAPGVTSVSPNTGNAGGGTVVTITGVNFIGVTGVMFGPNNATSFTVNSPTSITAMSPAGGNVVDVTVISAGGNSAILAADQFSYTSGTANWIVTNTQSSGAGSLFAAVQDANATTLTPSLITFDPTVFATPQTITLTSSLTLTNNSETFTIQGPSNGTVTVSGDRQANVLIQDFVIATSGVVATIENLTITNGNGGGNNGGGVAISAGNVTIENCIITNNVAYGGGGISVAGGSVLIENTTITGNSTPNTGYGTGAGLNASGGAVTIIGSLFTQNVSSGINGGTGGAIYASDYLTAVNTTFTGNTAQSYQGYAGNGGAVATQDGTLNFVNCTFYGNTASGGTGGAIYPAYSNAVTLTNDILWHNTANSGNDVYNGGTVTANDCLIGSSSGNAFSTSSGNILNVPTSPSILGSLANNGGSTQTYAPVAGSPEIGAAGAVTQAAVISSTSTSSVTVSTNLILGAASLPTLSSGYYFVIQIGAEMMEVIGSSVSSDTLTVVRGIDGTMAATHPANANVYLVGDQRGYVAAYHTSPVVDMGAVESTGTSAITQITTATLPNWTVNVTGYDQPIIATGGTGSYTFAVTAGALPTGLTLSSAGALIGTPTVVGTYNFAISATSTYGVGTRSFSMTINPALVITTLTLPSWSANQAGYSQTISATGGTGSDSFLVTTGALPTGLTLGSSGVLTGTPTSAGAFAFTVTTTDSVGATGTQDYSLTINLLLSPASLPNWTVSFAGYNQTITASGGTGSTTFAVTAGTLPTGLNLSSSGALSGTPTVTGSYSFTVTATDSIGDVGSENYTVTVNPPLTITTTSLANWTANQAGYNQTILAAGGTGSNTFLVTAGTLPTGLTLSSSGALTGTPTSAGAFAFTVTATDSVGATGTQDYALTINLLLSPASLPNWTVNFAGYNQSIAASGGTGGTTFAVTVGALPIGLNLSDSGVLSGTPTVTGNYSFTVMATDSDGDVGSENYTVIVNPPLTITTASLPNWGVNQAGYNQTILATGGTGNDSFLATSGTLPTGLILSSSGALTGTPTSLGTFTFTMTATDSVGATDTHDYTLTITPLLLLSPASLPNWTADFAGYTQTITATGGFGSNTFAVTVGALPIGLNLSSSGVLSGTPTVTGSYNFTVTTTDSIGDAGSQNYAITINSPLTITTASLPNWTATQSGYNQTISATGGTGSSTFAVTAGALPTGMSLSSSGVVSGAPTVTGNFTFTVTGTDSIGAIGTHGYSLTVPVFFQAAYDAILYLTPEGGSANAVTEFGIGTSIANHTPYFTGLPGNPNPNQEFMVGEVTAGSSVNFYEKTVWSGNTYWAFSNLYTYDQPSIVAFSDPDHDFSPTGNVVAQTSSTTWVLHLDDAASYTVDDNDSDVLVQVRLAPLSPTITGVSPNVGAITGGTNVTISGANFSGATSVKFGSTAATSFTINSDNQITAIAPAGAGVDDVIVTTADGGDSATSSADHFTYVAPPTVAANAANLSDNATTLTITGTGFDTNTANDSVSFNNGVVGTATAATSTQLTVTISMPPTALGNLTATVNTDGQSSDAAVQVATVVNGDWIVTDPSSAAGSLTDITLPNAVTHALSGDQITFASSLSGDAISLSTPLTIDSNITIAGPATGTVTLEGTLTVASAATLNEQGNLTIGASGTLNVAGVLNVFGTVEIIQGGSFNDQGTVNVEVGGTLSDQDSITVVSGAVLNELGNLIEGAGGVLTINLGGTVNVYGSVTIDAGGTLAVEPGGILNIYGTVTVDPGATYSPLGTVTVEPGGTLYVPPTITSVVINQDISALYNAAGQPTAGVQRSMVNDIVYTFSEPVNISAADSNVFTIAVASGWTGTVPALSWAPVSGSGNTEWAVTFSGASVTGNSIANGAYTITVTDPQFITDAATGTQTLSLVAVTGSVGNATQSFYRLFGDINGDEVVNNADNARFKEALSVYNPAFDWNQDGVVNNCDNARFKLSLSISFTGFTPTV